MRQLHIYNDSEALCDAMIIWMEQTIANVLSERELFTLALSGGSTPKLLYKKLAKNKNIDWQKIHFFWGDERTVPFDDERNNAHMAFNELLDKVNVNKEHIHIMRTDIPVEDAVAEYDLLLRQYFHGNNSFDLVLLGMGNDGHTLSLFPDGELLKDNTSWVRSADKTGEDIHRITLMPAIVNKAYHIIFMVAGEEKATMLKNVLELDPYYPANLIENNDLHWYMDKAAASLLK